MGKKVLSPSKERQRPRVQIPTSPFLTKSKNGRVASERKWVCRRVQLQSIQRISQNHIHILFSAEVRCSTQCEHCVRRVEQKIKQLVFCSNGYNSTQKSSIMFMRPCIDVQKDAIRWMAWLWSRRRTWQATILLWRDACSHWTRDVLMWLHYKIRKDRELGELKRLSNRRKRNQRDSVSKSDWKQNKANWILIERCRRCGV